MVCVNLMGGMEDWHSCNGVDKATEKREKMMAIVGKCVMTLLNSSFVGLFRGDEFVRVTTPRLFCTL